MKWNDLKVRADGRAFVAGKTGCGKTTLSRFLIEDEDKPYSVIYDQKIDGTIGKWAESGSHVIYTNFDEIQYATEPRLIYRPPVEDETDKAAQDAFFQWIYDRENTRVYVDEGYALVGGSNPSHYFRACLSRGRSRGISTVLSVQRPVSIPLLTISESEQVYLFRLGLPEDRRRMEEVTGISEKDQEDLRHFEFYYWDTYTGVYKDRKGKPKKIKLAI